MNKIETEANLLILYSALFCEPEEDLFHNLQILDELEKLQFSLISGNCDTIGKLKKVCSEYSFQELLVDYTKLFIGPFEAVAHPYSSIYLNDGVSTLYNETTLWVENFYNSCGYNFGDVIKDMPDHIAVELEFLYVLKHSQLKSIAENNPEKEQKVIDQYFCFLANHFNIWAPMFSEKIISRAENKYYITLYQYFNCFIENYLIPETALHKISK